jgi:hypothetical protein
MLAITSLDCESDRIFLIAHSLQTQAALLYFLLISLNTVAREQWPTLNVVVGRFDSPLWS